MVRARSKTDRIAKFVVTLVATLTAAMLAAHEPAQATSAYRPVGAAQELELGAGGQGPLFGGLRVRSLTLPKPPGHSGDVLGRAARTN